MLVKGGPDVLGQNGARLSAGTLMTIKLDMSSSVLHCLSMILYRIRLPDVVIQNIVDMISRNLGT